MTTIERLDRRSMLSVSIDGDGWTVVTPASDTRTVYVSNSQGNDSNNGLSQNSPVKSISRARSLIRDNSADWLLLKRGDTFESLGTWTRRGRSADEPILISAYGSGERPLIDSGTSYGINTGNNGAGTSNLVISALRLTPGDYDHYNGAGNLAGLRITAAGSNIHIEDVEVSGYKDNIVIAGESSAYTVSDVTIRRSQILDAHADSSIGNSQGIYLGKYARDVTIEENVIDHNGWRHGRESDRRDRNHNIYSQTGAQNVIVRDNIITRASFYGLKFNSGGVATGNFFARNSESVYLEDDAQITDNVITEAVDMPGFAGWGVGINTQKSPQATIRGNLITNVLSETASGVAGIQLFNNGTPFRGVVEDNIVYHWRNALLVSTPGDGPDSVVIRDNQFHADFSESAAGDQRSGAVQSALLYHNNTYSAGTRSSPNRIGGYFKSLSQWVSQTGETSAAYEQPGFPDPDRDTARYAVSIGAGGSFESFISEARDLTRQTLTDSLTATGVNEWFRAGFGLDSSSPQIEQARFLTNLSRPTVEIRFDRDVSGSVSAGDLDVFNHTSGAEVSAVSASYTASTRTARFAFDLPMPDGNYQATLPAGAVRDAQGNTLDEEYTLSFSFLAGDANHDRTIDISDFSILANRMNRAGTFSQGDFNYDGTTDIGDFAILAGKFNKTLPAPA